MQGSDRPAGANAGLDGQKVDEEIAKLRKLSVEYARSRREAEIEHAIENIRRSRSRSPSLPRDRLKALLSACGNGSPDDNVLPNGPLQAQNSNQHTLPRYFTRARSPLREGSPARSINSKLHNHHPPIVPPSARKFSLPDKEEHFLPVTLPDLPPYKMPATPSQNRRFSEESPQRRPLAVLHEDEVMARRRYSDDIRKKSYDTGPIMDDFASHQRKLSEAGIRRLSDASVVLTEDTDSFIIGDRVWVGGTKPGVISYIGEIQFAPGEWAGVTLDEPIGKNDGSVGGVRYFQCEPKKGVFSRLTRLSRAPLSDYDVDSYLSSVSGGHDSSRANGARSGSSASTSSCLMGLRRPSAPVNHAASPAPSSLPRKTSSGAASPVSAASELKVGERVVVNSTTGVKYGTLRYYGKTEFAEGVWAGVELDEPTGKNDGSVAGKRYFDCKASFGLFAPVGRVTRYTGTTHRTSATGIPSHRMPTSCLRHSGSRESLGASSVASSTASSVRGTRRPSAPSTTSVTNTKALQDAVAEKTQHVDQLMQERDVERAEFAQVAAQAEEARRAVQDIQTELTQLQVESEEKIHDLMQKISSMEKDRSNFFLQLEDKQKEIDELTFRLEEEAISKLDLESQRSTDADKVKMLENLLQEEKKSIKKHSEQKSELEEVEISLRNSIDEMQLQILNIERDKENLEKQLEAAAEHSAQLDMTNECLRNSVNEREQKIQLLELSEDEVEPLRQEVQSLQDLVAALEKELESKTKDSVDISQQADEVVSQLEDEKARNVALNKEILALKNSLDDTTKKVLELNESLREEKGLKYEIEQSLELSNEKINEVEKKNEGLLINLKTKNAELEDRCQECNNFMQQTTELQNSLDSMKSDLSRMSETQNADRIKWISEKEASEVALSKAKLESIELQEKLSELEVDVAAQKEVGILLEGEKAKVASLEKQKKQLEEQLSSALSSSSSVSDQLKELHTQLIEKSSLLLEAQEKVTGFSAELSQEKHLRATEKEKFESELQEIKELLGKNVKELQGRNETLEKESEKNNRENEERRTLLMSEIEELKRSKDATISDLEKQIGDLSSSYEDLQKETNLKLSEKSQLLVETQETCTLLEKNLTAESDSHAACKEKMGNEIADIQLQMDVQASEYEKKFEIVNEEKIELRKKHEETVGLLTSDLEKLKTDKAVEIIQLTEQLNSVKENSDVLVGDLKSQLAAKVKGLEESQDRMTELSQELSVMKASIETERSQFTTDLKDLRKKSEDEVRKLGDIHKALKEENERNVIEYTKCNEKLNSSYEQLKKAKEITVNELEEKLVRKTEEIEKMKEEYGTLEGSISHLKSTSEEEKQTLEASLQALAAQNEQLQQEKAESLTSQELLRHDLSELRIEIDALRKEKEEVRKTSSEKERKIVALMSKVQTLSDAVSAHKEEIKVHIEKARIDEEELADIKRLIEDKKLETDQFQSIINKLDQDNKLLIEHSSSLENDKQGLQQDRHELVAKCESLQNALASLGQVQELNATLEGEVGKQKVHVQELELLLSNKNQELCNSQSELEKLRQLKSELQVANENMEALRCTVKTEKEQVSLLKQENSALSESSRKLQEDILLLQKLNIDTGNERAIENQKIQSKVAELEVKINELQNVNDKAAQVLKASQEANSSLEKELSELVAEKSNLIEDVVRLEDELKSAQQEVGKGKKEAEEASATCRTVELELLQLRNIKKENIHLQALIEQLRIEVASSAETDSGVSDSIYAKLKKERDDLSGQVNFLNSVVVDMHHKNEDLKLRIQALEMANVSDDEKTNRNGKTKKLVTPRLFCDICDCFDLHDTEDCPKQASDSPPPTQCQAERGAIRPYCESCEVFGHNTGECEDETF